ncbi:MAG: hypothetical protein M1821_003279 [Bathelium mastoideum]|nr:MAG: hypothetical protein M1821_003279 [Bathelium mastoideum]
MPNFLDLPRELRNYIYEYVIPDTSNNLNETQNGVDNGYNLNFALTNHQICDEFSDTCRRVLKFPIRRDHLDQDCKAIATCIRFMNQAVLERLGSITIKPDRKSWLALDLFSPKLLGHHTCSQEIVHIVSALQKSRLNIHLLFEIPCATANPMTRSPFSWHVLAAGISDCVNGPAGVYADDTNKSTARVSSSRLTIIRLVSNSAGMSNSLYARAWYGAIGDWVRLTFV